MTGNAATDAAPQQTSRPQLTSNMRSSSYLSDHQQYRPPRHPEAHQGIDTVIEDIASGSKSQSPKPILPFHGIPSTDSPPTIVESGVDHNYSHPYCAPLPGDKTDRLVATLFYKAKPKSKDGTSLQSASRGPASESNESLPANMAPTANIEAFPMEPPTQDSEQLDHLYGSYVSPLCITSFLHLMSTFPLPEG
jgi:phosphoserine phosphatase